MTAADREALRDRCRGVVLTHKYGLWVAVWRGRGLALQTTFRPFVLDDVVRTITTWQADLDRAIAEDERQRTWHASHPLPAPKRWSDEAKARLAKTKRALADHACYRHAPSPVPTWSSADLLASIREYVKAERASDER